MNKGKLHWVFTLTLAAMLLLANRSHALFTSYLMDASNQLTAFRATLTNGTPQERRAAALIGRALADLSRPSSNVITDYNLFVAAALHLGPLINEPQFFTLGSNVFTAFTNDAKALIDTTRGRVAALSDLNGQKRAASNALVAAQTTLDRLGTIDPRLQIIVAKQVFAKITVANRLAGIAEAHPIYAPPSVVGRLLHHMEVAGGGGGASSSGTVEFTSRTAYTEGADTGTYTWRRTSPTTATLVLRNENETGRSTTTVKLTFTSIGVGAFTFHNVEGDGTTTDGTGTFTLE